MINKSVTISIKFNGLLNQSRLIDYFISEFGTINSTTHIHEIGYSSIDKTKRSWKFTNRRLKYSDKSIEKLQKAFMKNVDKIFIDGFDIVAYMPNYEHKSRDISISMSYYKSEECESIDVMFDSKFTNIVNTKQLILSLCMFLNCQKCKIIYGFVFVMKNENFPAFFAQGIKSENLNKKEKNKAFVWINNKNYCNIKIWDIFWGNIISKEHLKKVSIEEIEKTVGKENIYELSSDVLWFNLPEKLTDFDISEYSRTRRTLYKYFEKKSLIMTEE